MRLFKDGLETQRVGDSENPMKQNCSQLVEHGQLNLTIDWPLVPNMKKPAGTFFKSYTCTRQVVLRGGLTPAGFRFDSFITGPPALSAMFPKLPEKRRLQQYRLSRAQ